MFTPAMVLNISAVKCGWAPLPAEHAHLGSLEFAVRLAREADVAVSPGIGFGEGGDGHVRFALVENEERIRQATRNIRAFLSSDTALPEPPTQKNLSVRSRVAVS